MADEVIDGAPEGAAEVTDLRSTIRAAVESQRSSEPVAADVVEPAEIAPKEPKEAKPAAEKTETEAERNERLRDDKGKFATEKNAVKTEPKEGKPEPKAEEAAKETPAADNAVRPPDSWSPTAKVAFANLPLEVRQAVAKREEEVAKGFERYQRFKPVEKFDDMARQSGTTLDRALENYVGMETRLRQDFPAGITELCQRQGINPVALAKQILARNGVSLQQGEAGETDPQQVRDGSPQPASVDLAPIHQELNALKSYITHQQTAGVQTEIQRFASDPKHTFFENVKTDMGRLINSGQAESLDDAYDMACWANKEIRALLIKQQAVAEPSANAADAVQKARAAAKATGGAPSAGFKPNAGTEGSSIRDTIRAAVNSQRGI